MQVLNTEIATEFRTTVRPISAGSAPMHHPTDINDISAAFSKTQESTVTIPKP